MKKNEDLILIEKIRKSGLEIEISKIDRETERLERRRNISERKKKEKGSRRRKRDQIGERKNKERIQFKGTRKKEKKDKKIIDKN